MKFDIENHEKTHHGYLELTSSPLTEWDSRTLDGQGLTKNTRPRKNLGRVFQKWAKYLRRESPLHERWEDVKVLTK